MPDLLAILLASLPFVVFVVLVIETFSTTPTGADGLPVDLLHRSFGA
jgi:hypothetical protein